MGEEYRDLVICNNCTWATSLLKGSSGFAKCPICGKENIEVIPVNDTEAYTIHLSKGGGLDIDFTRN